ncbi:tlg2-vesicle protein of 38 kda [Phlyctema vagabunda]|uniref:Golgi apparatus membrane protein TVP38 n=1 Tax=Phlyctema vagabunda TaxID=108571 RepID=A0ABR4PNL6_9HELO
MPADYTSTARALALPISPIGSPSPEAAISRPPWSRHRSISRRPLSGSGYQQRPLSYKEQAIRSAKKVKRKLLDIWKKLSLIQRIAVVTIFISTKVLLVLFLIYKDQIFGVLTPLAEKWHDVRGGWTILWAMTFISAFPPLIGYSTTITIAGFVYGFPNGWFIVATATIAGSTASFLASRTVLSKYVHKLVGGDKRFEALSLTLKYDGIKILCMIRLCPLPYSLSNAAISTFPTVHPLSFALATALTSPKLIIQVFIGSRLASLAENNGDMDTGTKIINYLSIILGIVLGGTVAYMIYSKTMRRAKELEIEELEAGRGQLVVPTLSRTGSYHDGDIDEDQDAAALMNDDDISLWDNDNGNPTYRDEFTDDEDNPFARGDLDEETAPGWKGGLKP